jgi:signal peptidase
MTASKRNVVTASRQPAAASDTKAPAASSQWISRQSISQVMALAIVACSALMIWKTLIVLTNTESPIVVVLSGSMEPGVHRGDILFLRDVQSESVPIIVGDVVVFKIREREVPIVHRVIEVTADGKMLTRGDNNLFDDRSLYAPGQYWLERSDLVGKAAATVPYVGMVTIYMNEYPMLRFGLLGGLGLLVLLGKD